jgi:hypothetical protein
MASSLINDQTFEQVLICVCKMNPLLIYVLYDASDTFQTFPMEEKFHKIYFQWSSREKLQHELQRKVNIGNRTIAQNYKGI